MGLGFVHEPITLITNFPTPYYLIRGQSTWLSNFWPHYCTEAVQHVVVDCRYTYIKYTNLTGVLGQDVICWTFRHKCCRRPRQNFSLRVPLIINYIALIPSQYKMYLVCYALHYRRKRACRTVQPFDYFRSAEIGQILIT